MVKIHKGKVTLEVSSGAYRDIYQPSGWLPVDETPAEAPQEPAVALGESGGSNTTGGEETPTSGSQEPQAGDEDTLAKMSDDELKQYASLLGLKTKGLKTREDILEAIKANQK